ncbi:MAG: hypothetical protein LBT60_01335 [Oscillospiraceae bacterium]|nr:hypothetical protein [Oscillospiraceae bacterium]
MRISAQASRNLDMLCLLNTLTADEYYVKRHREVFDRFYPALSQGVRDGMAAMVAGQGYAMLSPALTLMVSALDGFQERSLTDMLACHGEIEKAMARTEYGFSREAYDRYFAFFTDTAIPLIEELEGLGFEAFWRAERLPAIEAKRAALEAYLQNYRAEDMINVYKPFDCQDLTVYICAFAAPHGIKLCGYNLISDVSYPEATILSNITHEVFHPPFDYGRVRPSLDALAQKPAVIRAFANQNPHSGYHDMDGFIEEHVVEALGIHVLARLGADIDPAGYFKTHDEGSHVISPYLYEYLAQNPKDPAAAFEDYFAGFADSLGAGDLC